METIKKLQDALTQCHYDLDDTRKRAEDDVGLSTDINTEIAVKDMIWLLIIARLLLQGLHCLSDLSFQQYKHILLYLIAEKHTSSLLDVESDFIRTSLKSF